MTKEQVEIILAVLAFLFGVVTKFVFDLWEERRKKQALTLTKKTLSAFSVSMLGEKLNERTQLYFSGEPVKSIQIFELEVENTGSRAVKNQAFTVRFDEDARILGTPVNKSHSEDARFVQEQKLGGKSNAYRFNVQLLQKDHRLIWEFAVVDNLSGDFVVEHGISGTPEDLTNVDLDVSSVVTSSKAQLNLIPLVSRIIILLTGIAAVYFLRDIAILLNIYQVSITLNITIVILLIFLLQNLVGIVPLWLNNFRRLEDKKHADYIYDSVTAQGNFVGRDAITYVIPYYWEISKEMAKQVEQIYEYIETTFGKINPDKARILTNTIKVILDEIKKGEAAQSRHIGTLLKQLSEESQETYRMFIDAIKIDLEEMPSKIQQVVKTAEEDLRGKAW